MFNMNERVHNPRSQIQSVPRQVLMFHPQASQVINPQSSMIHPQASQVINHQPSMIHSQAPQVIYPQPSMIHLQSYQVIHPQSYQVIHTQSSQVIHQHASQAPAVSLQSSADPIQVDSSLVVPYLLPTDDPLECDEVYFSFGRPLNELHVTWAHLEKKRTRLRTKTKTLEDLCSQSLETASYTIHDAVTPHLVTASHISRRRQPAPTQTQI
ncbi:hypothetical protein Tco_1181758 [Tanacetum coccineum]